MSDRQTITISKRALEMAQKRAAEKGLSPEDYVDELIVQDDLDNVLSQPWIRTRIEEGLNSGSAGELTRERLRGFVEEGIALAEKEKQ